MSNAIYDFFRWVGIVTGYPFYWLFFKNKIYYENDKARKRIKGGALIICNHYNLLDYVLNVFLFFPRTLYVVASEHAYKNALLRFGMKFWHGIRVDRTTMNMTFVSKSIREIKKGHLVLIFPEGHNTDDGTIKPFYPSYLLIALRSHAPIVPVITDGNYGPFKRVHTMFGEPIDLSVYFASERPTIDEIYKINDILYQKVLQLRENLQERIEKDAKNGAKQCRITQ